LLEYLKRIGNLYYILIFIFTLIFDELGPSDGYFRNYEFEIKNKN
jgi:hypothetical protein